ncbi:MAG: UDP-3-O-acyl-N-acetylglucosamine deacetylase [bacterium]|nr:UDP-3-O-acyl-N-acetylglucosamine deacetylase [bacterium]MDD5354099.1 UDP-3-O-acyl-N-acetylglucosamine deacetylase [bacterium]MDD5756365.1 UDP-3-O-acyl-N-acetylglucosamine deacetylase [bacterium]
MEKQKTLKEPVSFSGVGLHTGSTTTITFKPAPVNTGIKFIRVDQPNSGEIAADIKNLIDVKRGTNIGLGNVKVHTVEHILSALAGLGIDNIYIEINANEPPVGDGSALPFIQTLQKTSMVEQEAPRNYYELKEPVYYIHENTSIIALPADDFKVSLTMVYNHPLVKSQHASFTITPETFIKELAPARTFCFDFEIETLKKQGLAKGGNLTNAVVIGEKDIHNELRFPDEFVRHKILDLIGDFYLLGQPLKAHIIAVKCGHPSNVAFVQKLRELKAKGAGLAIKETKITAQNNDRYAGLDLDKPLMDINEVQKVLPHRPPFLLVDKILKIEEDKKAIGLKNVTINEDFFRGHFPGHPVMPGVLLIESMAQVAGVLLLKKSENAGKLAYFMTIDKVKFRQTVVPGDTIFFEAELLKVKSKTGIVSGKAYINSKLVAEAEFMFTLVDR